MRYNPFLVIQAVLSLGACIFELNRGNFKLAGVYFAWMISNMLMSMIEGK